MQTINKRIYLSKLFAIYGSQLTAKQRDIFINYYEEDQSINEICELLEITKNGVYNSLKQTETKLEKMETDLKIYQHLNENRELLQKYKIDDEIIKQIK